MTKKPEILNIKGFQPDYWYKSPGMQVIGRYGEEGTLLRIANAYEKLTDYAYTHPIRESI